MNEIGRKYVESARDNAKKYAIPHPSEQQIQERVMRIGEEAKAFDADTPGLGSFNITDDLREIAVATIINDRIPKEI